MRSAAAAGKLAERIAGCGGWMQVGRSFVPVLMVALGISAYAWAVFVSTFVRPGSVGLDYIGPGTDWMVLVGALRLAAEGRFNDLQDGPTLTAYLNTSFAPWLSRPLFLRPFVYPPSMLTLLQPFARLGFIQSYVAFQLASAGLLVGALLYRPDVRRAAPAVAAAALLCPAASINAVDGQLGFLVTGVLVLGFRMHARHPFAAGAVLGLLSVKPQFAVLVPVVLLARADWRGLAGAAGAAGALVAVSAAQYGLEPWFDWTAQALGSLGDGRSGWAMAGRLWGSSVFACAVVLGLPEWAASLAQGVAMVGAAGATVVAVRSVRLPPDARLAAVLACVLLAAPHWAPYDAVALPVAASLWLAGQERPGATGRLTWLGAWILAMIAPPVLVPAGRLAPVALAGFIALVVWGSIPASRAAAR